MSLGMLRNYIKIAFRNLWRFKAYSLINVIGLALGLTVTILIMLFVQDELSFDQFHTKSDRIYKVVTRSEGGGGMETNSWPVASMLARDYAEVEAAVYTRRAGSNMLVWQDGKRYHHELFYADNQFLQVFSFDMIQGDGRNALEKPFTMVLTKTMANRYFPQGNALGKTLILQDSLEFEITGILNDLPSSSHIQFEGLISFSSFERLTDFSYTDGWGNFNVRNYILLRENTDLNSFASKAGSLYRDNVGEMLDQLGIDLTLEFVPLDEIYLYSDLGNGFGPQSSISRIYLVSAVAIFVLLLACINYINLSTARSVYRAKEVGMRKIAGSSRTSIFWQFQTEVLCVTLIAFFLVVLILEMVLPFFNDLMEKQYVISTFLSLDLIVGIVLILILVTFSAGFYPSLVLSGYKPADVLKSKMGFSVKGANLRRGLVIFQFAVSAGLVMATFIVIGQLRYMQDKELGFDKEHVVAFDLTRVPNRFHETFLNRLRGQTMIESVSLTNALPARPGWLGQWAYAEDQGENAPQVDTEYMAIDENYLETLGLTLIAGRNFNPDLPHELDEGLIINETTVREMGWGTPDNAIGKRIESPSSSPAGEVIGVVRDYHGLGLQNEIWPKAMDYAPSRGRYAAVRISDGNIVDFMDDSRAIWDEVIGEYTYEYFFLDEEFDRQYRGEVRLMRVFVVFASLTLLIAIIGLLGLVSFMVVSRTREIGIRKILGASESGLVKLLSKEFIFLVITANVLIIPLIWISGNSWLDNFAYHGQLDPTLFLITLVLSVLLAFLIVGVQTFIAARQNPVQTLRNQ